MVPPKLMRLDSPRAAATMATDGSLVTPWSRPTPYTVYGRNATLEIP
jgi:hypothetical protein